jgi:hypothetical protein
VAVVSVRLAKSGRSGKNDAEGIVEYERAFIVRTSSFLDDAHTVRTALTVPRINDPWIGADGVIDNIARCKSVSATQDGENPLIWEVQCQYSSKTDDEERRRQEQNPLLRPPKISFKTVKRKVAVEEDADEAPVVNSAFDPFDPPLEVEFGYLSMDVEKNIAVFDPIDIEHFVYATNGDEWLGWDPGTVLCTDLSAQSAEENGVFHWQVKASFEFDRTGWDHAILSAGFNQLVNGVLVSIRDTQNEVIKEPALLDFGGARIDPAALQAGTATPFYLKFRFYENVDFSELPLP